MRLTLSFMLNTRVFEFNKKDQLQIYVLKTNNHYDIKYLTININQILPKLLKCFHPLSLLTYLEKRISTKSIFKY